MRNCLLSLNTGCRVHIMRVSTWGAVEIIRLMKSLGAAVTCEICPLHFTFTDEAVGEFDTLFKVQPPLRTQVDIDLLLQALNDGTIDCIASDHSPHASYEVDVLETIDSEEISTYCAETDAGLGIGQPCLVHLSFKLHPGGTVSLTAIYRSQYYVAKALGNFVGLAQLLAFVAAEANLKPSFLVCHATMAEIDLSNKRSRWKSDDVRDLIGKCRAVKATEAVPLASAF